jgi:hypothetical protein
MGSISALPAVDTKIPCVLDPATEALAYIQAWELTASGYKAIFDDAGPVPAAGSIVTTAAGTGLQKAANKDLVMSNNHLDSPLAGYFDPAQNPQLARMEAPLAFVLIWTTDAKGAPLAWWFTTWQDKIKMASQQNGAF